MTINVPQQRFANQGASQPRNVFQEFTDMFTAFRLLAVADKIEGVERAGAPKQA